jgi:drug/metabolite transporter (DMT)-like permease
VSSPHPFENRIVGFLNYVFFVLAWWQCAVGTLALAVWLLTEGWPEWGAWWAWLWGLGLIHTGLAYTLTYAGMARLSAVRIAVFQFIYPAVAIVIDGLIYAHGLGTLQLSGIAIMAVAIWFAKAKPGSVSPCAGCSISSGRVCAYACTANWLKARDA